MKTKFEKQLLKGSILPVIIKPVKVEGKIFLVSFVFIDIEEKYKLLSKEERKLIGRKIPNYYNAYVYLDKPPRRTLNCETYREGHTLGVDTAHWQNNKMNLKQKMKNAEKQIRILLEDYKNGK